MPAPLTALLIAEAGIIDRLVLEELRRGGYDPTSERVDTLDGLQAALARRPWDLVLAVHPLVSLDAQTAWTTVQNQCLNMPFLLITALPVDNLAVGLLKAGAQDLIETTNLSRLLPAIQRALRADTVSANLRREEPAVNRACPAELAAPRHGEARYRQAQKLAEIGRLASTIAHEFNNLLLVVLSETELLLPAFPPGSPYHDPVKNIHQAGELGRDLTHQLLALSSPQASPPGQLDINAVVADMARALRRLLGKDIDVATALAPHLHAVTAERSQIDLALLNLAVNARDAMPHGGKLTLSTCNVVLKGRQGSVGPDVTPGPYVLLTVSDTGCGMDAAVRARLFEPFFTTKAQGKGTGLGLTAVQEFVCRHGGQVEVASEPGQGTSFQIYLPAAGQGAEAERSRQPPNMPHTGQWAFTPSSRRPE
jgi:signal transduction histidine kinase